MKKLYFILPFLALSILSCSGPKNTSRNVKTDYSISLDPTDIIAQYNKQMLLGTNAGVFYEESYLMNLNFISRLRQLNPGIIRIPGGSWSNELYWNGNRVRISEESYIEGDDWNNAIKNGKNPIDVAFDMSKYKDGKWDVDYSGYAPGFRIKDTKHHLSDFHGFTDVLFLHKFIRSFGAETMVTVNMGTGTVKMAVEWVKWVKNRQNYAREPFDVKYWEMGNEMDGDWELGYTLPDGSKMNAKEYIRRYKLFATAMKKADPAIKVGGSVASSMELKFIEELIKEKDAPIDFISFHAYPSNNKETDFVKMADEAAKVNDAVKRIKNWLKKYRPNEKNNIEIAVTEWNIKVKEDITTVNLTNTLWSAVMLGEMAKAGVDIAIQWDMFSTTNTGGHGLFNPKDKKMNPRSQYWAMYLWSHFMGEKMIKSRVNSPDYVRTYATIENDTISLMIINGSEKSSVDIRINIPDKTIKKYKEISYSNNQYNWGQQSLIPIKSKPPVEIIKTSITDRIINIPAYSIKIVKYTFKPEL